MKTGKMIAWIGLLAMTAGLADLFPGTSERRL